MFLAFPGRQFKVQQDFRDPSGTTILVAEPSPGKRRTLFFELIRTGSAVLVTSNRDETLAVLQRYQGSIDIVLIGAATESFDALLVASDAYLSRPQARVIQAAGMDEGLKRVRMYMAAHREQSMEGHHVA